MTLTPDIGPGVAFSAAWIRKRAADARRDEPTSSGRWQALYELATDLERAHRSAVRAATRTAQADLLTTTRPAAPAQAAE